MVIGERTRQPGREHIAAQADAALAELTERLTRTALDASAQPQQQFTGPTAARSALERLATLAQLHGALERQVREAAAEAAAAGANYAQLGAAWNITRQGARKRWPGLVFTRPPLADPATGNPAMSSATPRPYRVLLVEDDDADALLIQEALLERGMARSVDRACDGIAALAHLRDPGNTRPDLIVLDLNMPRMNGRELLATLKSDPSLATVPVVVLTTSAAPDDITSAYQQHANAYVTKPVNLDDFIRAVQSIDAFFLDTTTKPVDQV